MLWCPKLAIELPDGSKVAQSRGWINELSADWNVIIEHNDSGATPVKHPDQPRYTFAKSKGERGEDAYRYSNGAKPRRAVNTSISAWQAI